MFSFQKKQSEKVASGPCSQVKQSRHKLKENGACTLAEKQKDNFITNQKVMTTFFLPYVKNRLQLKQAVGLSIRRSTEN